MKFIDFNDWYNKTSNAKSKEMVLEIHNFILDNFKDIVCEIKWNTPMYVLNKTFILGLSALKAHVSLAPEKEVITLFKDELIANNYIVLNNLFKIGIDHEINFDLIKKIIDFNIESKKDSKTFFR